MYRIISSWDGLVPLRKKPMQSSGFHSPAAIPRFLASACESGPAHQKTHQVSYPHLPQLERTNVAASPSQSPTSERSHPSPRTAKAHPHLPADPPPCEPPDP